jgi:uncharacterized protein (UPF0335 family)
MNSPLKISQYFFQYPNEIDSLSSKIKTKTIPTKEKTLKQLLTKTKSIDFFQEIEHLKQEKKELLVEIKKLHSENIRLKYARDQFSFQFTKSSVVVQLKFLLNKAENEKSDLQQSLHEIKNKTKTSNNKTNKFKKKNKIFN